MTVTPTEGAAASELSSFSPQEARALTDKIKVAVEGTWQLIEQAYTLRAWASLGYRSWDDYCQREFGTSRLRLPREERQEVVASLRESGLSIRAIASATGLSHMTVGRDLAGVTNVPVVTGSDGKSYSGSRSSSTASGTPLSANDASGVDNDPDGEPVVMPEAISQPKRKQRPLPAAFDESVRDMSQAAARLTRLQNDKRFAENRPKTHRNMADLIETFKNTVGLIEAMDLPNTPMNEEARRWWATSLANFGDALHDIARTLQEGSE